MLRAIGLVAVLAGAWVLWRGRTQRTSCYKLKVTTPEGAVSFLEPRQLTEDQAKLWEVDAREQYWGAAIERVSC